VFGFANFTRYEPDSAGRSFAGGAEKVATDTVPPLAQGSDPSRDWSVGVRDDVITLGLGLNWNYSDRLTLEAQYVYVDTTSETDFGSGGAIAIDTTPLPDVETTLHSFTLSADYQWRDNTTVVVSYQYYDYKEDDWALDDTSFDTIDNVLLLGERPDDEAVNLFGVSFRYAF
jgi:long-subunit fatty acid transport protein